MEESAQTNEMRLSCRNVNVIRIVEQASENQVGRTQEEKAKPGVENQQRNTAVDKVIFKERHKKNTKIAIETKKGVCSRRLKENVTSAVQKGISESLLKRCNNRSGGL